MGRVRLLIFASIAALVSACDGKTEADDMRRWLLQDARDAQLVDFQIDWFTCAAAMFKGSGNRTADFQSGDLLKQVDELAIEHRALLNATDCWTKKMADALDSETAWDAAENPDVFWVSHGRYIVFAPADFSVFVVIEG